jgi:hypothetical protein
VTENIAHALQFQKSKKKRKVYLCDTTQSTEVLSSIAVGACFFWATLYERKERLAL